MLKKPFISLLLFALCSVAVQADTLTGKVVKITDGDTLVILDASNTQHKIRLAGIDAPETKQPFGQKSKEALTALVAGQHVAVDWDKRDRYQRILGKVIAQGKDVNLAQVRSGMAWWYRKYREDQSLVDQGLYAAAEAKARISGVGLWAEQDPIPPWEWRKR
jgi:endonuclease YncB( thermonuclease family)